MVNIIPMHGEQMIVEVKNFSPVDRNLFPNEPDTIAYTGMRLRSEPSDDPDTFRMTGDRKFSFRVIPKTSVVSINGEKYQKPWSVPVNAIRGYQEDDNYIIAKFKKQKGECSCSEFKDGELCKHLKELSGFVEAVDSPW